MELKKNLLLSLCLCILITIIYCNNSFANNMESSTNTSQLKQSIEGISDIPINTSIGNQGFNIKDMDKYIQIEYGEKFALNGMVYTIDGENFTKITAYVSEYIQTVVSYSDKDINIGNEMNLNLFLIDSSKLPGPGVYTIHVWAKTKKFYNPQKPLHSITLEITEAPITKQIVDFSKKFIGRIPYKCDWLVLTQILDENNPPIYMDCADFTSSVYKTILGIEIGYNTDAQIKRGKEVNKIVSELKLGDLLIFDWDNGGRTDHVAMYIGNNQIIHESGGNLPTPHGNVKISNINDSVFSKTYWHYVVGIRRIVKDDGTVF